MGSIGLSHRKDVTSKCAAKANAYVDPEVNQHGDTQFKPNTTVAAVIHHQGKFLLVEEIENSKTVFNQPAGHIEKCEDLIGAIRREVLEETGLALSPDYLSKVYYIFRSDLNLYFLRFCFVIELDSWLVGKPQDDEIITTHWLTLPEIQQKSSQLRSTLVLECIEDYLSGNKIPLSSLKSML
jgi:phosphatase NudJ